MAFFKDNVSTSNTVNLNGNGMSLYVHKIFNYQ